MYVRYVYLFIIFIYFSLKLAVLRRSRGVAAAWCTCGLRVEGRDARIMSLPLAVSRTIRSTKPVWHLVDAKGQVTGRLATQLSYILRGKVTAHIIFV